MKISKNKFANEFFRYLFSASTSFVIDIILFYLLSSAMELSFGKISVIYSTVIARLISSLYNYYMNSRFVFKSWDNKSIWKYYSLVFIQMAASAIFVYIGIFIFDRINKAVIKVSVDIAIFIVNFFVQRAIVFRRGD